MIKKRWPIVAAGALVLIGSYVFRTYPRHVVVILHGIQYQLGTDKGVKPVTLTLNGTREQPLFGAETFDGIVDISGASNRDCGNGHFIKVVFEPMFGGLLAYWGSAAQPYYDYGAIFPNASFTEFTVTEWQQDNGGSGWSGGNGLVISAPAKTRAQALIISNDIMAAWSALRPGHPLR